jgi:hypothetical protein
MINHVVSREETARPALRARIRLENTLTDAKGRDRARLHPLRSFQQYRESLSWRVQLFDFLGKVKGTDRPLKPTDIGNFGSAFHGCSYRGFGLSSPLATLFAGRGDSGLLRLLTKVDTFAFVLCLYLERYSWFVATYVER